MKWFLSGLVLLPMLSSFADQPDRRTSSAADLRDKLRIAAQKICPVSGNPLDSAGTPVKTKIGDEELFLCCARCSRGKVNPRHWNAIHNNLKTAQGKCPVMGKPLPPKAKWTLVNGQIIYVCCPPCIEKIQAQPDKWLAKVDKLYSAVRNPVTDELKIAAQKICPVSGKKLNAQGKAIKTKIGAEELFLCCEKCTRGRVNPDHWKSVHANLKTAQATCPIMGKKLPPKSKWTIVNGQIIYVCCPPCTQKIKADATESLKRVAASYRLSVGRQ